MTALAWARRRPGGAPAVMPRARRGRVPAAAPGSGRPGAKNRAKNSSLHCDFELISTIVALKDCEIGMKIFIKIEILEFRNFFYWSRHGHGGGIGRIYD